MKLKKLDKKIMTIYINNPKTPRIKNKKIEIKNITNDCLITKYELINKILNQKMNLICFDCRKKYPKNISINNAIFLCQNCASNHKKNFSEKISFIIDNNLNLLSINYLRYLFIGGNQNLDNFINYVFPGLQNYPPQILYRTQALIYYRDNLKFKIGEGPQPICPNELMAYKIVSENGLINIRDKKSIFHNLNLNLDNNDINSNNNNDIINNYFNNYNNTYNTYNHVSITNEDNQDNEKNTIGNIGISLSNKAFFKEMKNLFGKRYIKAYKKSFDTYKKLAPIKSFNDLSKIKYKKIKEKNEYLNRPLTYRLNESLNYSFAKAKEIKKNSLKNLHINNNNNKSSISFMKEKSPKNSNNTFCSSPRYIKPNIKNMKNVYGIDMKYIENGELKKIYNNKNKFNNILQQKNILKHFKIQKKTKRFLISNSNNNKINTINNINNSNLNINNKDKIPYKEQLLQKINKKNEKNNLYLFTDYANKSNDILINDNNNDDNNNNNNSKENKKYTNNIPYYKNYNKKNKIIKKINNINVSFDDFKKIRPIKVKKNNYKIIKKNK